MGMHCMAHQCNLVMQTLFDLPTIARLKNFIQSFYIRTLQKAQRDLKFIKLVEIMETKGNKILCNVKTY
jgi:hypothetical protein